jgi:hypothetical protein
MSRTVIRYLAVVGDATVLALLGKAAWGVTLSEKDLATVAAAIVLIGLNVAAIFLAPTRRPVLRF